MMHGNNGDIAQGKRLEEEDFDAATGGLSSDSDDEEPLPECIDPRTQALAKPLKEDSTTLAVLASVLDGISTVIKSYFAIEFGLSTVYEQCIGALLLLIIKYSWAWYKHNKDAQRPTG